MLGFSPEFEDEHITKINSSFSTIETKNNSLQFNVSQSKPDFTKRIVEFKEILDDTNKQYVQLIKQINGLSMIKQNLTTKLTYKVLSFVSII